MQATIEKGTGLPEVVSPPLSSLLGGGQKQPDIVGTLVPQAVNMWIGSSAQGQGLLYYIHPLVLPKP